MPPIELLIAGTAAVAYLLSALRLICYCRGRSRYRRCVSLFATLLGAALCLSGLDILLHQQPVSLWQAIGAVLVCWLIFQSRGNVAALLRPNR